jgi:putative SOS response-associated peptidase YedK
MCGRYTITFSVDSAREDLGIVQMPEDYRPRYNVAPAQPAAVVSSAKERSAQWMRWGLVPFWAKDAGIGNRLINARCETIAEKPAFKRPFLKQRCLVLSDGFFEWKRDAGPNGRSQPYYFHLANNKPFAYAGLWDTWRSPEGEEIRTFTIITCAANELVKPVHERMPVMLSGDALWAWLSAERPADLQALLKPYPAQLMASYPVSAMVNRPEIDAPELIHPLAA